MAHMSDGTFSHVVAHMLSSVFKQFDKHNITTTGISQQAV